MKKIKPLKAFLILMLVLSSVCLNAQDGISLSAEKKKLKGTWISRSSAPDTLKFYFDDKGVDCAIYGHDGIMHGYFVELKNNSISLEGLCNQKKKKWRFKTHEAENLLIVEDFYRKSKKDIEFTKISAEVK